MADETYTPDKLIAGSEFPALTKAVTVLLGQNLVRGAVVGAVTRVLGTVVAGGGNTGNGTVTAALKKSTQIGNYILSCIAAGVPTAGAAVGAAVGGNTGDGTITAAPTVGAGAKVGVYRTICMEPATNLGKFTVEDPDGITVGVATVGTQFVGGGLTFTIADGATDFASGDAFTITVAAVAANSGTFSVIAPDGTRLKDATVGVAYATDEIGFTISDGATDFVAGDNFTIPVTVGSGKMKLYDKTAVDGSQNPLHVIAVAVDATAADQPGVAYETGIFNRNALTFANGTAYTDAETALRARGIFLRDMRAL